MSESNEHLEMIKDCEARESRMTEWEGGFIDSVRNQIENGTGLSAKQEKKLDMIWESVTSKG